MSFFERVSPPDQLFVQQKFAPIANRYYISTLGPDGKSPGQLLAFVKQKRMKIREDIRFFDGEEQTTEVLRIKAKTRFEFRGRYDIELPNGQAIGQLKKDFWNSLIRSRWLLFDGAGNQVAWCQEKSLAIALLRRFVDFVPIVGGLLSFAFKFVPFHFDLYAGPGHQDVGDYVRLPALRDRYRLDLTKDTNHYIDRRLALAWVVALDCLTDR